MFGTVAGARAAPPTTGLVASAPPVQDGGARWESGLAWVPERCGAGYQLVPWCSNQDPPAHTAATTGAVYHRPVGARFAVACSTLGGGVDSERTRRVVEATTPFVIARELWDGALGKTDPFTVRGETWTNARLADLGATVVGTGAADLLPALGRLEQAAVEASKGQRVMLHLSVALTARLGDYARRVGSDLLTRNDNLVIADAGYPGTGPITAGTSEVKTISLVGGPTGGTFTLTYSGQTTAPIAWNATAATVQAALEALSTIEVGDITVTGSGPWTITFLPRLGNVPSMTGSGTGLTGGTPPLSVSSTSTAGVDPGPTAGTWAYATSLVQVRTSPIVLEDDPASTVNRAVNTVTQWAVRVFAATFDPCVHLATQIT